MRKTTIKAIKQGEFFRLKESETAPVWVRGYYVREDGYNRFEAYKWDGTAESFFKGSREVFVDFEF